MTEQREQELVSASIDRELNADERIELDSLLESSSEARELKTELEQLDSLLNELPDLDPPPSLQASIMAQSESRPAEGPTSPFSWLRDLVPGSGLRYVLATGAGALIALIVIGGQPLDPGQFDYSQLVGTASPDAARQSGDVLDSYAFSTGAIAGQMQLRRVGNVLFLDIESDTEQPLDIAADFGAAGLSPDVVAQVDGRAESIAIAGQAMRVQTSGKQRLTILLRRVNDAKTAGEAEISLEVSSEGRVLDTGELTASW